MIDLSLHILDIAQNSIRAQAKLVSIKLIDDRIKHELLITIADDGIGMSEVQMQKLVDPFYTTRSTRKVGLGIPLFKQTLEQTGGYLKINSQLQVGTTIEGMMKTDSIDSIPLGDLPETLYILMINPENVEFIFQYQTISNATSNFQLDTREIKTILAGVSFQNYEVMNWIKEYLASGIADSNS